MHKAYVSFFTVAQPSMPMNLPVSQCIDAHLASTYPPPVIASQQSERLLLYRNIGLTQRLIADGREFVKISQAVGMGFLIMGAIGYVIKLSMSLQIFTNTILVSTGLHKGLRWLKRAPYPSTTRLLQKPELTRFPLVHIPVNNILVGGA